MPPFASSWILMLDLRWRASGSRVLSKRSRISSLYSCAGGDSAGPSEPTGAPRAFLLRFADVDTRVLEAHLPAQIPSGFWVP